MARKIWNDESETLRDRKRDRNSAKEQRRAQRQNKQRVQTEWQQEDSE